jgi:hypothetical protein
MLTKAEKVMSFWRSVNVFLSLLIITSCLQAASAQQTAAAARE